MTDINDTGLSRCALISDLSCFGKCSLTVQLPIISAMGIECAVVPTAVLSTHTGGFENFRICDMTDMMSDTIQHWKSLSMRFDMIMTGYLCSKKQIEIATDFIDSFKGSDTVVIVDPVMADYGIFYSGFDKEYADSMRSLCKKADCITPNITEACLLCNVEYSPENNEDIARKCLEIFQRSGIKCAVITSVSRKKGRIYESGYMCMDRNGGVFSLWHEHKKVRLHGCGDVFAAVLCASIAQNEAFYPSVIKAAQFTNRCIKATDAKKYPGHFYSVRFEQCLKDGI